MRGVVDMYWDLSTIELWAMGASFSGWLRAQMDRGIMLWDNECTCND